MGATHLYHQEVPNAPFARQAAFVRRQPRRFLAYLRVSRLARFVPQVRMASLWVKRRLRLPVLAPQHV